MKKKKRSAHIRAAMLYFSTFFFFAVVVFPIISERVAPFAVRCAGDDDEDKEKF